MSRASSVGQQLRSLVRKAGVLVGTRTYLNFVEGANTTITIADDSANDEVTVTIASTASGGAAVADGPGANVTVDGTGAAGVSASAARVDHGHQLATYSSAAAAVGTAAAGTSTTAPSRGDHVHATGAGTPSTQAFGDAAATGTGPAAAMTDHKHAMPSQRAAASASPAAIGTAAAGTGTTDARDDHVHATGAGTPSTQAFGDAAATGTGPAASMTDHKHAMPAASTVWAGPAALSTVVRNTLAGAVDNYALAAAEVVSMFDVGASNRNFSGMASGTDGRAVFITNSAAANNLIILHDSTSTAANRFYCPSGNDVRVRPRQGVWAVYDSTLQRWVLGIADAPNAGPDANITIDAAGAAGTAGQYARAGHGHQLATASATPAAGTAAGTAGTSTNAPSRSDHAHPTTLSRSMWVIPGDFWDGATPAVPTKIGTAPDAVLASATMSASAQTDRLFTFFVPSDWSSGAITYTIYFSATTGDASAHTIQWQMDVKEIVAGTTLYDAAGTSTAFTGASAARTAKVIYTEAAQTLLTPTTAGNMVRCAVSRLGASGSDTMTDTCQIHGLLLKYTATA